jgi:hypothetical protein
MYEDRTKRKNIEDENIEDVNTPWDNVGGAYGFLHINRAIYAFVGAGTGNR